LPKFAGGLLVAACMLALAGSASAASPAVLAWGENEVGELGNGTTAGSDTPTPVSGPNGLGLGNVTALAAGRRHSLALLGNGTVMAWGENEWGQLGDGTNPGPESCHAAYAGASGYTVGCSRTPVLVPGLSEVVAIAAAAQDSYALLGNGTVMAWGDNESGQLGDGSMSGPDHCYTEAEPTQCSTTPVPVDGLSEVTAIAAGQNYALALLKDGTVMAWGSGTQGDLGDGNVIWGDPVPAPIRGLSGVTAVAAGGDNGLALLGDGVVEAWGANEFGQLGDGTLTQSDMPVAVSGLDGITAVAIGGASLALRDDGSVMAWGSNISGQLGDGTQSGPTECFPLNFCSPTPVEVNGIEHATAIAAGGGQSLALLSDGAVMAWGLNWDGQLGDGSTTISDLPVSALGIGDVTAIAAGDQFSLAYGLPSETPADTGTSSSREPRVGPATEGQPSGTARGWGVARLVRETSPLFPLLAQQRGSVTITRAQRLARALKACKRKPRDARVACERRARR
jgi:alpha-tubulin suppressor-like RCC1 family protein